MVFHLRRALSRLPRIPRRERRTRRAGARDFFGRAASSALNGRTISAGGDCFSSTLPITGAGSGLARCCSCEGAGSAEGAFCVLLTAEALFSRSGAGIGIRAGGGDSGFCVRAEGAALATGVGVGNSAGDATAGGSVVVGLARRLALAGRLALVGRGAEPFSVRFALP